MSAIQILKTVDWSKIELVVPEIKPMLEQRLGASPMMVYVPLGRLDLIKKQTVKLCMNPFIQKSTPLHGTIESGLRKEVLLYGRATVSEQFLDRIHDLMSDLRRKVEPLLAEIVEKDVLEQLVRECEERMAKFDANELSGRLQSKAEVFSSVELAALIDSAIKCRMDYHLWCYQFACGVPPTLDPPRC